MNYKSLICALITTVAVAGVATASEIYKWTDEEGNVHYTDTPMGDPSQRLDIQSRPTNDAAVQHEVQARLDYQDASAEELANTPQGPTAAELRAERQARAEQCSMYRERLTRYLQSRRLYKEDENGERVYMDEAEMQATREKVVGQVEEHCDS